MMDNYVDALLRDGLYLHQQSWFLANVTRGEAILSNIKKGYLMNRVIFSFTAKHATGGDHAESSAGT